MLNSLRRRPRLYTYTMWYGFTVKGNMSDFVHSGSVAILAPNEEKAREWFKQWNPDITLNMVTVFT